MTPYQNIALSKTIVLLIVLILCTICTYFINQSFYADIMIKNSLTEITLIAETMFSCFTLSNFDGGVSIVTTLEIKLSKSKNILMIMKLISSLISSLEIF